MKAAIIDISNRKTDFYVDEFSKHFDSVANFATNNLENKLSNFKPDIVVPFSDYSALLVSELKGKGWVNSTDVVLSCNDKMKSHKIATEFNLPRLRTWANYAQYKNELNKGETTTLPPMWLKPVEGCGSKNGRRFDTLVDMELNNHGRMVQQFEEGKQISACVYIDINTGRVCRIYTKEKLEILAGTTVEAITFNDDALNELILRIVYAFQIKGVVDIDIWKTTGKDGKVKYKFGEINPRFGGCYPFTHFTYNFIELIRRNLEGESIDSVYDVPPTKKYFVKEYYYCVESNRSNRGVI